MLGPRWRKVLNDVWGNKTRTVLVVLSIAIGVSAVGMMVHMNLILARDVLESYAAISPAHATLSLATDRYLSTFASFDDDLVETIRKVEGVRAAEGRRSMPVRFKHGDQDEWLFMMAYAFADYEDIHINKIRPETVYKPDPESWPTGTWPPPEREIVLERTSLLLPQLGLSKARLGDVITIQAPDGSEREVRLAGLAHDFSHEPASLIGAPYGYVTLDTIEWLGGPRGYSDLNLQVTGDASDKAHIERVAERVRDKIEENEHTVGYTVIPDPGTLPTQDTFQTISLVLGVLGLLSLFLSSFLMINTVSALLAQQTRQIGVMKAFGAGNGQIMGMYLAMVMVFGLLALVIAVPLGILGAGAFIEFLAYFLNFKAVAFKIPPEVIAIEVVIALLVPLLAALVPIINGTRVTVRQAITFYGLEQGSLGTGLIDRLLERIRGLPRPVALSVRNTFRRKGRLALTLITLTLACASFISVMSARSSAYRMIEEMIRYWNFDVEVFFPRSYRNDRLFREVMQIPGTTGVETLTLDTAYRIRPDGSESEPLRVIAVNHDTKVIQPPLIAGRWLLPGDENAVVLNKRVIKDEPDIKIGDDIRLKIHGRETTCTVVGMYHVLSIWHTDVHISYDYFSHLVNTPDRTSGIAFTIQQHDEEAQSGAVKALEEQFKDADIHITLTYTTAMLRAMGQAVSDVVIVLLSTMAILVAVVGGMGLMGTMSLNVLERRREIGVMRAIGASDGAVWRIVMTEGILIGTISWGIGAVLAFPMGKMLSDGIGIGFMGDPFPYVFSMDGALICLVGVVFLSAAASFLPAQGASRLTVREVLAYE